MEQDRLSDQALLKLLDSNEDLSFLTPEEKQRMVTLAAPAPAPAHETSAAPSSSWADTAVDALPGAMATGYSFAGGSKATVPGMLLAGLGGMTGEAARQVIQSARGDFSEVPPTMGGRLKKIGQEGLIQGGLEGGGRAAMGTVKLVARGLMKGAVPKNIAKEFQGQVDIPREMLERNVLPGVPASARRVSRLSSAANVERDAAAQTVPVMSPSKVIAALWPAHAEAVAAREPQLAEAVLEHMRTSARNIGPEGLTGPQALARKDVQQRLSKAALNNPQTAAIAPQLHNAERGALVSHLRQTPRMGRALDESQALMAIDEVMKDAALSNPVTRARIGGLSAAALSPIGLGVTAQMAQKSAPLVSPAMLRAIQLAMLQEDQQ